MSDNRSFVDEVKKNGFLYYVEWCFRFMAFAYVIKLFSAEPDDQIPCLIAIAIGLIGTVGFPLCRFIKRKHNSVRIQPAGTGDVGDHRPQS